MAGERDENSLNSAVDEVFGADFAETQQEQQPETQPVDEGSDGGAEQQPETLQQEGEEDPLAEFGPAPKGPPERDAQGRIIGRDGKPIEGRQDKRDFYAYNRLRLAADKLRSSNEKLEAELAGLKQVAELPGRLGLQMADVQEALHLRAQYNDNPVQAVRDIVALALQNGYSMEDLFGGEAVGYINGKAIGGQIKEHMRPLTERIATQEREERIKTDAQSALDAFVAEHEYADIHGELIARAVDEAGYSPEKAYYELRMWAQSKGLDFSQPLQPQLQRQPQQQQRQDAPPAPARSTPGGRRVGTVPQVAQPATSYAPPDASFRDIVSGAFRSLATQ